MMKYKKSPFFIFFLTFCSLLLKSPQVFSQKPDTKNSFEDIYSHWFNAMDKFQSSEGIGKSDFELFKCFSENNLDSLRGCFMKDISEGKVTLANISTSEYNLVNSIKTIYGKFETIKKNYPTSIEEYRNSKTILTNICDSACNNIDFETGNLSGWYAYYAYNNSNTSTVVNHLTGGLAGPVIHAANDTLTSSVPPFYNTSVGKNPRPDYQVNITSGSRGDGLVPSIPVVSPFGGSYSVMLGDSTLPNYGVAILSQTFLVGATNANFTYQYAVFLENPTGHSYYQQPFFKVAVLDAKNDTIPFCGEYYVVSRGGIPGFHPIYYAPSADTVYYKDWAIVNVPLTHYIGQCVTVVFEVGDCALGGHFGYAYIDASCSPLEIISSSQNFCGQDSIVLTGPGGEGQYYWTGPDSGIMSNDTLQQISVDSAGTYTCVITPFTGASCRDTMTITIGKVAGPPPHPDFTADTGCAGLSTSFFNTSNPIAGAKFYWDFYNNGVYEDSAVNPTWTYNLPGIYTVKLEEIYNGCGMDTTINVVVDTTVASSFIADTVCFKDTTMFTNTTNGGKTYYWNFGDPASGLNNTSLITNPGHSYTAPGTYTVSLIGKHSGWCNDTTKGTVVVRPLPKITLTASTDSLCSGSPDVLVVSGGSSYHWSTGATTSTITVSPTTNTSYTASVSNGICSADTVFTLFIKPVLSGTVTGSNVCFGDTINLSATGGGTYLWNTGATTSSIHVASASWKDTAYSVMISNGGSCVTLNKTITIFPLPSGNICCDTTIFSGDSIVLNGSGGASYYWIPPDRLSCDTCPNPIANPTITTTYTLVTTSNAGCTSSSMATITVDIPCRDLFIPNVFTPNGDSKNDTYLIKVEFITLYQISIYNRWGKEIFTSNSPDNPWDGNIDGSPASDGVYYYIIHATCLNGNNFEKHGFLQLIR